MVRFVSRPVRWTALRQQRKYKAQVRDAGVGQETIRFSEAGQVAKQPANLPGKEAGITSSVIKSRERWVSVRLE